LAAGRLGLEPALAEAGDERWDVFLFQRVVVAQTEFVHGGGSLFRQNTRLLFRPKVSDLRQSRRLEIA